MGLGVDQRWDFLRANLLSLPPTLALFDVIQGAMEEDSMCANSLWFGLPPSPDP